MENDHQSLSALVRATVFVRDLDRAEHFYRELGLSDSYYEGVLEHESASQVLGFDQHQPYDIKILKIPGPNFGMLGLFQLGDESPAEAMPPATGAARIGEVALVFYVNQLDDVLPKLKEAGALWLPDPVNFEMGPFRQREICLRDCDGTLINLVERHPSTQWLKGPEMTF